MSRTTLPYHRRYHGDALTGCMNLTLEERGAYSTLLDLMYDAGGPINFNERMLAGFFQCSIRLARKLVLGLVEKGKIRLTADNKLSNRRFELEMEYVSEISRKRAENASKPRRRGRIEPEKASDFNEGGEQMLGGCALKPDPEPDNKKITLESEVPREPPSGLIRDITRPPSDPTFGRLLANSAKMPFPEISNGERLLAALDRRQGIRPHRRRPLAVEVDGG